MAKCGAFKPVLNVLIYLLISSFLLLISSFSYDLSDVGVTVSFSRCYISSKGLQF